MSGSPYWVWLKKLVPGYGAAVPELDIPLFPFFSCPWSLSQFHSSLFFPQNLPMPGFSLANKQDKTDALPPGDIIEYLLLERLMNENKFRAEW